MALRYRVVAFNMPMGPWRTKKRQAEQDAVRAGLGEYDDEGQLYLDGVANIQWMREADLRLRA